jgi:hypothetical protein
MAQVGRVSNSKKCTQDEQTSAPHQHQSFKQPVAQDADQRDRNSKRDRIRAVVDDPTVLVGIDGTRLRRSGVVNLQRQG